MALLSRKRVILAKIESVYGTDSTPTGSANAMLVRNLDVQPYDADMVSRDLVRPYLGNFQQIVAGKKAKISFEVELAGSGTAGTAPAYGPLLRACGMSETITAGTRAQYKPVSASFDSATIYVQLQADSGTTSPRHKILGCRGTVEFSLNAGQIPVAKFTMTGLVGGQADVSNLTADYTAFQVPLPANQANTYQFQFHGYDAVVSEFGLNLNNTVVYRNLINQETILITDRKSEGSVKFDAPLIGTKDFFSILGNSTPGDLIVRNGNTAGTIVEFTATAAAVLTGLNYGDGEGIVTVSTPFVMIPTSGNDEFTLNVR